MKSEEVKEALAELVICELSKEQADKNYNLVLEYIEKIERQIEAFSRFEMQRWKESLGKLMRKEND